VGGGGETWGPTERNLALRIALIIPLGLITTLLILEHLMRGNIFFGELNMLLLFGSDLL
jgi:hypothetical protein